MRWAWEISTPCGFMASVFAAENVDARRMREAVNAAVGLVAVRKAVRANIVSGATRGRGWF